MIKKKLYVTLGMVLALVLLLLLTGCGGEKAEEAAEETAAEAYFYDCWEYAEIDNWVCFYETETYEWYDADGSYIDGVFFVEDGVLYLEDIGMSFEPFGDDGLMDSDGDEFFRSELPDFDFSEESDVFSFGEDEEDYDYDYADAENEVYAAAEGAEQYYGTWEYQYYEEWVVINPDGTYEWYDLDGLLHEGYYEVSDGKLHISGNGTVLEYEFNSYITDQEGNILYHSMLPDYDGTRTQGADIFIGCWESVTGGMWLEIYDNGEYLFMWDDGYGSAGDYAMEGSTLLLQTGARFTYDSSTGEIKSDDYVMFRSEMPEELRP